MSSPSGPGRRPGPTTGNRRRGPREEVPLRGVASVPSYVDLSGCKREFFFFYLEISYTEEKERWKKRIVYYYIPVYINTTSQTSEEVPLLVLHLSTETRDDGLVTRLFDRSSDGTAVLETGHSLLPRPRVRPVHRPGEKGSLLTGGKRVNFFYRFRLRSEILRSRPGPSPARRAVVT